MLSRSMTRDFDGTRASHRPGSVRLRTGRSDHQARWFPHPEGADYSCQPRQMERAGCYGGTSIEFGGPSIVAKAPATPKTTTAYCMKCKTPREMTDPKPITMKNGRPATEGTCPVCSTRMFKIGASM